MCLVQQFNISVAHSLPPLLARLLLSVLALLLLAAAAAPPLLLLPRWQVLVRVIVDKLVYVAFLTLRDESYKKVK